MDAIKLQIEQFEQKLTHSLVEQTTRYNILAHQLLESADLDDYWQRIAPEYLADGVLQVKDYPLVSLAWAAYLGMGVAHYWDSDWENGSKQRYADYYGDQGFDNMDDHIMANILGIEIDSLHATTLAGIVQNLARTAISAIRHEGAEPQTRTAYLLYAAACRAMYRIGAAIELYRLNYKMEKL